MSFDYPNVTFAQDIQLILFVVSSWMMISFARKGK
jgi:hypothetical protein